ncbi:MAG: hypothetical protein Sapg2KO_24740 [Saprospiraceae bacterium]
MAKQKKKVVNKGPFIKNANLIGKGEGQVKPVDGSFVKGLKAVKQKAQTKNPSPKVKEHVKTEPAKTNPGNPPARRRQLGMDKAKKTIEKIVSSPKTGIKKPPTIPKQKAQVTTKKAPSKAAVSAIKKVSKQQASPKKTIPVKAKKGPVKGR